MATYSGSIFGKLSGQASGVVASAWKGIKYIRSYVVPANPQSTAQTLQRTKFKNLVDFGRRIIDTVLNPDTLPAPKKMSAFNYFISKNVVLQTGLTIAYNLIKLVFGSLFFSLTSASASEATGNFTINWSTVLQGEALATDDIVAVIYDPTEDLFGVVAASRSDGTISDAFGLTPISGQVYHLWIYAIKTDKTGTSESVYDEIIAGA